MNYQGRLLNDSGVPVTGSYNFVVRVYDAATSGTLKYQENHNGVSVDDGVYAFLVGTQTKTGGDSTWSVELWNCCSTLFLEIVVNGEILSPRHRLAAAPFAFQANLALTTNNALALGGVSATQYNNTLASICVSGKGKWLELANAGAGACLGIGSSFPGPTRVNWNTLTASNDFKDLDLSRADISGINFGSPSAANMTNTRFTTATYSVAGMSGANLTSTQWDGAIATDASAFPVVSTTKITKATMKNMDMSKWNLSLITSTANFTMFSAAYLSACPAAVIGYVIGPRVWECKLMRPAGSSYFMVGPYVNFSTTSAASISSNGGMILDLDKDVFDGPTSVEFGSFVGVTVMQDFTSGNIYYSDFSYAKLANMTLTPSSAVGVKFPNSEWENVIWNTGTALSADFSNSRLANVVFAASSNLVTPDFSNAVLSNVYIDYTSSPKFINASLGDVNINSLQNTAVQFNGVKIFGHFYVGAIGSPTTAVFNNIDFINATVSGALTDTTFTGTLTFKNTVFKNLDLCSTVFPLVDTSAPHNDLAQIKWEGPVECPNGDDVVPSGNLYTNTCNNTTRMTQTAVANCLAGIPGGLQ